MVPVQEGVGGAYFGPLAQAANHCGSLMAEQTAYMTSLEAKSKKEGARVTQSSMTPKPPPKKTHSTSSGMILGTKPLAHGSLGTFIAKNIAHAKCTGAWLSVMTMNSASLSGHVLMRFIFGAPGLSQTFVQSHPEW